MAKAHNYRRINYVYSLREPQATDGLKLYLTLDVEKKREEAAEVEEVADGRWKLKDYGVRHAKPNFISHFEKHKLNINAREKPKKNEKQHQNLSTTKGNTRPINSRTINVMCAGGETHQKIDNDASWKIVFVFFFYVCLEMKTNLCATCSQRPFGVSSAQPDFPAHTAHVTWMRRESRGEKGWQRVLGCSTDDLNSRHGRRLI